MSIPQELIESLTGMFANAINKAIADATQIASVNTSSNAGQIQKHPPFSMSEYKSSQATTVEEYFTRFDWALQLSSVPVEQQAQYARVNMGAELNNALRILVSPKPPEDLTYKEIKQILVTHFDATKNKYAESIKFRQITQFKDESIASFVLRLKNGAVHCEYGNFLDRMLIEQLLHGLESREICDAIIGKKPETFAAAYEIAQSLEVTRNTTAEINRPENMPLQEGTHRLGFSPPKFKNKIGQTPKQPQTQGNRTTSSTCNGCGGRHTRSQCKFNNAECFACGKRGHISRVCKSKTAQITEYDTPQSDSEEECIQRLNKIHNKKTTEKIMLVVQIDGRSIHMELDTGSPASIISLKTLRSIKKNFSLQKSDRQFSSYTFHKIVCLGRLPVVVKVGSTSKKLNLYVVEEDYDSLFGREWIAHFTNELNFKELLSCSDRINAISTATPNLNQPQQKLIDQLVNRYEDVFSEVAGMLSGPPISVHLKPDARPVFAKAREIPLALRDAYANEIEKKLQSGHYKRVDYSEWASTTHIVAKKNGKIRITGNYKTTINPRMIIDEHPIPRVEHIFNQMKGANIFCHLDVTDAYTHLPVDEEFSHALTLNTPTHGLIRPTRAVYGAANIPAIWQRRMEAVLQDIPNVRNFFDDILVYATNFETLLNTLDCVLERMRKHGLRLNRTKCVFATSAIEFLGHRIDSQGIHKSDKHIETVRDAPKPSTPEELQLFLGKASYYNSFIPDLATRERPLRDMLLKKQFEWSSDAHRAYDDIKSILVSPQVLMPYDPTLPLILATDASKTGLGAVLSHRLSNGQERPIAYASRTMTTTEQRYPQIDKEALAIVWAVKKFFLYLYARHWTLITDHKPLTQILHPEKSLPNLCISRMANYADFLGNFDYDVIFKPTKANTNADYCSRVPLKSKENLVQSVSINQKPSARERRDNEYDEFDHFVVSQINQLPIQAERIAAETRKDEYLGKIVRLLESGQCLSRAGYKAPESLYKLSANCLVFEHRVVIPTNLRKLVLKDLHAAHLGMVKMKGLARSFIFWPGLDGDIETTARECIECSKHAHAPPKFREHHWDYPKGPWERIHVDYAGPYAGMMLLVISDAYSKWLEVKVSHTMTTSATISMLDELFAAYGVPVSVVTDNGTNFASKDFKLFLQTVGVKYHRFTAPYHPSSNGQAERSVQTVKDALRAMQTSRNSLQQNLNIFLRQYRKAPHSTTGQPPSQLFLGRVLRTSLDLIKPDDLYTKVTEKQNNKFKPTFRTFDLSDSVFFLTHNPRMDKWVQGKISKCLGDLHYEICYNGKLFKRHVDQIRSCNSNKGVHRGPRSTYPFHVNFPDDPKSARDDLNNGSTQSQRNDIVTSECLSTHRTRRPLSSSGSTPVPPTPRPITPRIMQQTSSERPHVNIATPNNSQTMTATPIAPRRSTRPIKPRVLFSP